MKIMALVISIFIPAAFAAAAEDLRGQAGKAVLEGLANQSGLWGWGSIPAGHILNNSSLIEGGWIAPADRSSMETPSMVIPQGGGLGEISNLEFPSLTMPAFYQMDSKGFGSNVKKVFDCTCFTAPTEAQFPRVY